MSLTKQQVHISKFLSLVLRHKPETIHIALDPNGWVNVTELLEKINAYGIKVDAETLDTVVANNPKQRFAYNPNKTLIRANQGHSVTVNLNYTPKQPPEVLYHGTAIKNKEAILQSGLQKMQRHHVHLSKDVATALNVGKRHGKPMLFKVNAQAMANNGFTFYESDNGVWLTDAVPVTFLTTID